MTTVLFLLVINEKAKDCSFEVILVIRECDIAQQEFEGICNQSLHLSIDH